MFLFYIAVEATCTNQKDCLAAAKDLGYAAGGKGFNFSSPTHQAKGCYSYSTGDFRGHVYFGTGGDMNLRKTLLKPPKVRVRSAKCGGTNNPAGTISLGTRYEFKGKIINGQFFPE